MADDVTPELERKINVGFICNSQKLAAALVHMELGLAIFDSVHPGEHDLVR